MSIPSWTRRVCRCTWITLLILALPGPASCQMVGIYSDSLAGSCNLTILFPGPPVDVFVVFTPGPLADSLRGASFRIEGLPEGWNAQAFANPNAEQVFGSPFDWPGTSIAFRSCQAGGVVLYRLRLTPTSAVVDHEMQVREGPHPTEISCPYTFQCEVEPGTSLPYARALINSTTTCSAFVIGHCPVTDAPDPAITTSLSIVPNPPTKKATIRYSLEAEVRTARLTVYDLHGRVVARILEGAAPAREGSVIWDGLDGTGVPVSAGVYIVCLVTDRSTTARKIVICKH